MAIAAWCGEASSSSPKIIYNRIWRLMILNFKWIFESFLQSKPQLNRWLRCLHVQLQSGKIYTANDIRGARFFIGELFMRCRTTAYYCVCQTLPTYTLFSVSKQNPSTNQEPFRHTYTRPTARHIDVGKKKTLFQQHSALVPYVRLPRNKTDE